jgi:tetratricopeptide (TPR) repeat protein
MLCLAAALILLLPQQPQAAAPEVDPGLRAAVERFFETQQAEDLDGYLALWSSRSPRPPREQLQYIFDSGDDEFSGLAIVRAMVSGDAARVRVTVTRLRTDATAKRPDGRPRTFTTRLQLAISLVREAGEWRVVREGSPADELAQALIQTEDPEERRRIRESEPDLLNSRLVEAIARRADSLAQTSQYKAAQVIYERSLEVAEAIGDRKAEGQAIQNVANSLYFQRDFERSLALYDRRLTLEREIANDEGIASALLGIATIRYADHRYGEALRTYREALAIQERLDDNILISTTLISTGNVLYLLGDYEAAIVDYRRSEELKRKGFDLAGAASALEGLGRVYTAQGNYAAALSAFGGVLDERRKRNDIARLAFAVQSIGEIHFRLGNVDQARASFDEARKSYEAVKDVGSAGRVLQGTALNELVAGQTAVAERAYAESIALCTKASDKECIARAQVGLAFALAAQEKYEEAVAWYRRSIDSFLELNMAEPAARARIGLADALLGKGEHTISLEEAAKARHVAVGLKNDDVLWRALLAEARAERKLGKAESALGAAKAAVLAVERLAAAALDRPGRAAPRDAASAYAVTALLQAEAGDAAAALDAAERMRAHGLRAWLAPHEREIARGMTAGERDEERRLATELSTLVVRQERLKDLPKPDVAELEALGAEIGKAAAARRGAQDRMFARLPELRTWRGLGPVAAIDDLRREAAPGRLLLQFVVDDRDIVVIATSEAEAVTSADAADGAGRIQAHTIPITRQDLGERVARALDGKVLADEVAWRRISAEIWKVLPASVVNAMSTATSVVIIPDGVWWRVPFEAMPVGDRFLADRVQVSYAASMASLALPPGPTPAEGAPALIVHSPALPAAVVEELKATAPGWTLRSPDAAAAEAARIAPEGVEPAPMILSGPSATLTSVVSGFSRNPVPSGFSRNAVAGGSDRNTPFSALHLAAPFRVNSASPLFSPLLLAAPSAAPLIEEGEEPLADPRTELTVRDLFTLDPLAPAVMLSDPAALGRRDAASNLAPIDWAWRSAGASTLILRRWDANDETAAVLIGRYYEEMRKGASAIQAFETARAALRATRSGRAPAAWAGWLLLR